MKRLFLLAYTSTRLPTSPRQPLGSIDRMDSSLALQPDSQMALDRDGNIVEVA